MPGDWLSTAAYPVLIDPMLTKAVYSPPIDHHWEYTYDGLGRLTAACLNGTGSDCTGGSKFTYAYDLVGNLERFDRWNADANAGAGAMETVTFYIDDGTNQIECVNGDPNSACGDTGDIAYIYDALGNLTFDGTTRYVYDTANRLVTVCDAAPGGLACLPNGDTTTYQYSGDGDRVAETYNGARTEFTLDVAAGLTTVLAETTGSAPSAPTITYLYGLGLVAQSSIVNQSIVNTEYLLADALGSVRQVLGSTGAVQMSQTFDPYGNLYQRSPISGADPSSFGWTGEQSDPNGLTYLRARYYAPGMGRFTQIDPFDGALAVPASMNGYAYGNGSPLMYTDPSGELFILTGLALAAAIVVIAGGVAFTADYTIQSIENGQQGMDFWQATAYYNHDWGQTFGRTGEAMLMTTVGLAAGWAIGAAGLTGAAAWWTGAAVDVGFGTTWDMAVHGDNFGESLFWNAAFFGAGEIVGYGLKGIGKGVDGPLEGMGRLARAGATDDTIDAVVGRVRTAQAMIDMRRLAQAGIADDTIDALLPDEALVRGARARSRLIKEVHAEALAVTTKDGPRYLTRTSRGPVQSGATHPELDQVFLFRNHDTIPPNLRPVLQSRLTWLEGFLNSRGRRYLAGAWEDPGLHAEIWALNEAIIAREAQLGRDVTAAELGEFMIYNLWIENRRSMYQVARRCHHCYFLTLGATMVGGR